MESAGKTDKMFDVWKLLPKDGTSISSQELKDKAAEKESMSPNTLYKYLKMLVRTNYASREYGEDGYPPKVYYRRTEPFELTSDRISDIRAVKSNLLYLYDVAEDKEKEDLKKKIWEKFEEGFKAELSSLPAIFWLGIKKLIDIDPSEFDDPQEYHKRFTEFAEIFVSLNLTPLLEYLSTQAKMAKIRELDLSMDDFPHPKEAVKHFSDDNLDRLLEFRGDAEKKLVPESEDVSKELREFYSRDKEKGGENTNG